MGDPQCFGCVRGKGGVEGRRQATDEDTKAQRHSAAYPARHTHVYRCTDTHTHPDRHTHTQTPDPQAHTDVGFEFWRSLASAALLCYCCNEALLENVTLSGAVQVGLLMTRWVVRLPVLSKKGCDHQLPVLGRRSGQCMSNISACSLILKAACFKWFYHYAL